MDESARHANVLETYRLRYNKTVVKLRSYFLPKLVRQDTRPISNASRHYSRLPTLYIADNGGGITEEIIKN